MDQHAPDKQRDTPQPIGRGELEAQLRAADDSPKDRAGSAQQSKQGLAERASHWMQSKRAQHPRATAAAQSMEPFVTAFFYAFDVITDCVLFATLFEEGEHPWWAHLMLVFLLLPTATAWIGCAWYAWKEFTSIAFALALVFGPVLVPLLDITMLFAAMPCVDEVLGKADAKFRVFLKTYHASRLMTESLLEALPQLILQVHMFRVLGESVVQPSTVASLLNFVWTWGRIYLDAKADGTPLRKHVGMLLKIGGGGFERYLRAIRDDTVDADLDLSNMGIGAAEAELVARAIVLQSTLKSAKLKTLTINVALDIEHLKTSTSINLSRKGLRSEEAIIVAKCIEFNRALTSLNLEYNWIGAGGAKAIADSLPQS